jgi:hypothetical protein
MDYASLTVKELKAACKENGLPVGGKKADLIERLESMPDSEPAEEPKASNDGGQDGSTLPGSRVKSNPGNTRDPNRPMYNMRGQWLGPPRTRRRA